MTRLDRNFRIVLWASLFAIALSILVIVGWIFDIAVFKTIVPGYVSMKVNTALCFLLTASTLILYIKNKWTFLALFLASLLTLTGLSSLLQDILNLNLGIDQLFIQDLDAISKGEKSPGRPSPMTAICFFIFGLILIAFRSNQLWIKYVRQFSLHLITLIAFIAVLGYLFNVPSFYKLPFFTSMAIHTSITFLVLSATVSLINADLGVTSLFYGRMIGNHVVRKLFAKILAAVLILGYIQLISQRVGLVSVEFGIALFTTSFVLVVLYVLWSTSKELNRIDIKREQAELKLVSTNKNLERIVAERTKYLTKQNNQLEDFAHIVSHNLRGPISNLKSLLSFYNQEESNQEQNILIEKFKITVTNLESTFNELLEVVSIRHESKKEKEELAFEKVIKKLMQTYQGQIMETKAKVTYNFSAAKLIKYSSVYLESIMQNLLSNAIKYRSPERDPIIHFETRKVGDAIWLTVSDNGLGINMKRNRKRLFGLHKTFHKHPEAKGVGLFITKAQVEAMGGEISAESQENIGTTFTIKF